MLDKDQIAAASRTLHQHWQAGTKLGALEPSFRPRNRAEGYAIQAAVEDHSAAELFGWKIAATSEAGQKQARTCWVTRGSHWPGSQTNCANLA